MRLRRVETFLETLLLMHGLVDALDLGVTSGLEQRSDEDTMAYSDEETACERPISTEGSGNKTTEKRELNIDELTEDDLMEMLSMNTKEADSGRRRRSHDADRKDVVDDRSNEETSNEDSEEVLKKRLGKMKEALENQMMDNVRLKLNLQMMEDSLEEEKSRADSLRNTLFSREASEACQNGGSPKSAETNEKAGENVEASEWLKVNEALEETRRLLEQARTARDQCETKALESTKKLKESDEALTTELAKKDDEIRELFDEKDNRRRRNESERTRAYVLIFLFVVYKIVSRKYKDVHGIFRPPTWLLVSGTILSVGMIGFVSCVLFSRLQSVLMD